MLFFLFVMRAASFASPWPDPNSPVLAKLNFGVPLVQHFGWLEVRDTLVGKTGHYKSFGSCS